MISTAAAAFQRNDIEVVGILHGYSHLAEYSPEKPLVEGDALTSSCSIEHAQADAEHAGNHDRHGPDQPGQERRRIRRISTTPSSPRRSAAFMKRCCSIDVDALISHRRRRHAQDGQQVQAVSGSAAGRRQADSRRPSAEDDRQRLHRHRLHVRLFHGGRVPGRRDSQPAVRRRGRARLIS